jgi:hypothetical protein
MVNGALFDTWGARNLFLASSVLALGGGTMFMWHRRRQRRPSRHAH